MFSTILVPLDGSPLGERALPFATAMARSAGAQMLLLNGPHDAAASTGNAGLTAAVERLRQEGVAAEWVVQPVHYPGQVGDAICRVAELRRVDLVAMSTLGRSGLGRWLYGSVADHVLRRARQPVMLVPVTVERAWDEDNSLRILVPQDGSALAAEALAPAEALAEALGARLLLLRVASMLDIAYREETARGEQLRELEETARPLRSRGREVDVRLERGRPAPTIIELVNRQGADLIVMATRGRSGLGRMTLGSVSRATLEEAHVPIVFVRPSSARIAAAEMQSETAPEQVARTVALTPAEVTLVATGIERLRAEGGPDEEVGGALDELLRKLE
jgi:nucleotide-binding universal stress UspA family protein